MENIEQLLSRLEERYGNPEAAFLARAGTMRDAAPTEVQAPLPEVPPVSEVPETRIEDALEICTEDDWEDATAKLQDIQSLTDYISQSAYKDREILLKILKQYTDAIERKMAFPEEEEDQCAETWLFKVQNILKKRFKTLCVAAHRMKQVPVFQQGLQMEIKKYFAGLGMNEHPFREGDMISGQEEWFDILPYPNDDAQRDMRIKEIEVQPYYIRYVDNEEEDAAQAVKQFIFPGQAWVYEKKKGA